MKDEDGVLMKLSEEDKVQVIRQPGGIGSGTDLPAVKIARWSTRVDISMLAWGQSKRQ